MPPRSTPNLNNAFCHEVVDLYGETALREVLEENLAESQNQGSEHDQAPSALGYLGTQAIRPEYFIADLVPEAITWAKNEMRFASNNWAKYSGLVNLETVPFLENDNIHFNTTPFHPNFLSTLKRLYEAKMALLDSDQTGLDDENLGASTHLVLIPWQYLRDNFGRLGEWLGEARRVYQGLGDAEDMFNRSLLDAMTGNAPIYRNPQDLGTKPLTSEQYLDAKIEHDGPWGMMLMQTNPKAGVLSNSNKSADELTSGGRDNFKVAGQAVDAMGVYEWLALTLQQDPSIFTNSSLLLACRIEKTSIVDAHIPIGSWNGRRDGSVEWWVQYCDDIRVTAHCRLAIS